MSLRPMPPALAPAPAAAESDLDSTAELPVLDAATGAAAPADEAYPSTDTWTMPPALRTAPAAAAAAREPGPGDAQPHSLAAKLREAEELLASKSERLTQLERARDEAYAARAAAEQRAAGLSAQLAEQQAPAAEHAAQLDEALLARAAADKHLAQLGEELAQTRALLSAAVAHEEQLQHRLDEQESSRRAQYAEEIERHKAQAARGRAHNAGLMGDLHLERARTASYLESLRCVEARRLIAQELLTDMQREADARETEVERLARELAGRDGHARGLDAELAQRGARIARLEQQLSAATNALSQSDAQLHDARQQSQWLQLGFTRLQTELTASGERQRALEALVAQHTAADRRAQEALQRLQAERAELSSALESARAAAAAREAQAMEHDAALAGNRERHAQLETALAKERQRAGQLESELERVRGEMEDWGSALRVAQQERDGHLAAIAAAQGRVRELELRAGERGEELRGLQSGSEDHAVRELEEHLRSAEETIRHLQSEALSRNTRVGELEKANQLWRSVEDARHVSTDTAANPALREAARDLADEGASPVSEPAPIPDGALRLLIQAEDGREVVHVLGRKTSIGRTPDNDVQIDAKYVSRHHAVILVGAAQAIIEDLNSTNGVQVNGRRITRQTLKDGDQLAFGRSLYRFAVRKSSDKR
jgi:chromosome segregation ATPase